MEVKLLRSGRYGEKIANSSRSATFWVAEFMAGYRSPRRINIVSLAVFLVVVGGAYAAFQFGPVYYRQFHAKEVLADIAVRYADRGGSSGIAGSNFEDELVDGAERALRNRGITDPGLRVRFEVQAGRVTALAEYSEIIKHPLINKITVLPLKPSVSKRLRSSPW